MITATIANHKISAIRHEPHRTIRMFIISSSSLDKQAANPLYKPNTHKQATQPGYNDANTQWGNFPTQGSQRKEN